MDRFSIKRLLVLDTGRPASGNDCERMRTQISTKIALIIVIGRPGEREKGGDDFHKTHSSLRGPK